MFVVGSKNESKLRGFTRAVMSRYRGEKEDKCIVTTFIETESGVSSQPMSWKETRTGADNRAKQAYEAFIIGIEAEKIVNTDKCSGIEAERNTACSGVCTDDNCGSIQYVYGVGIESGIMRTEGDELWLESTVVSIYDGKRYYYGTSSTWQLPEYMVKLFKTAESEGKIITLNDVAVELGWTSDPAIGNGEGIVGLMTGRVFSREEYTYQGCVMALSSWLKR